MISNAKRALKKLEQSPLKLTSQRIKLIETIFSGGNHHYTANEIHKLANDQDKKVSLATIYNSLKQFTKYGIVKEVRVSHDKVYYDTNHKDHHHFFYKKTGKLEDIEVSKVKINKIPDLPEGSVLDSVEVIINVHE